MYKRKVQRIKLRSFGNSLANGVKITKWKFMKPLYLILSIILLNFLTLYNLNISYKAATSHTLPQSDPRYKSDLDISWEEILRVLYELPQEHKIQRIGLVNFNSHDEVHQWHQYMPNANHTVVHLDYADENTRWETLYPEWIDEEQEEELPRCPSLPNLKAPLHRLDLLAVKLPCQKQGNWSRDIARLHLQIAAANLAASYKGNYALHVLFVTSCFPLPNLFTCRDLVVRESNTWLYKPDLTALRQKLRLPIGSCELALPLPLPLPLGGIHENDGGGKRQREAYVTILHSAYIYVCGAIVVAQSIRMSGSTRDLVILVDHSISDYHRNGLELAGWQVRTIDRIRNPKAEKDAYNEWNYSKFRLWQLTDYDKIIFIDSDLLILRNIDFLFRMPEISATGNSEALFNSGVMVVEPSNCTFHLLMDHINDTVSYNGGDQGYLNEIFTWWHRIPKHVNFLKHFWVGDDVSAKRKKMRLFEAEPPVLYVLHYLGNKPWMCFRDYDCNWNVVKVREFASDVAHRRWWRVHDAMPEKLHGFCMLRELQKAQLEWDRREAEKGKFVDGHWKIRIKDERLIKCNENDCNWREKLRHWGEKTAAARLNHQFLT